MELLSKLEYNIYDNNETKDRKLTNNRTIKNIYKKKDFKVRICYHMLTPDKNISYYDSTLKKIYTLKNNQNKNH